MCVRIFLGKDLAEELASDWMVLAQDQDSECRHHWHITRIQYIPFHPLQANAVGAP